MRRFNVLFALLFWFAQSAMAQEILGTVTDKLKEPLINVSIFVRQGGIIKGGDITDFDGKYSIKPLEPGFYDVTMSLLGYKTITYTNVLVSSGEKTGLNCILDTLHSTDEFRVQWKKPIIECRNLSGNRVLASEEIKPRPAVQTTELVEIKQPIYKFTIGGPVMDITLLLEHIPVLQRSFPIDGYNDSYKITTAQMRGVNMMK